MPITADQQRPPAKKKSGMPIGLILVVVYGLIRLLPRVLPHIALPLLTTPTLGLRSGNTLLPYLIGGLVAALVAVSVVRRVASGRGRNDSQLPTSLGKSTPTSNPTAFRGQTAFRPPIAATATMQQLAQRGSISPPQTPRFDPAISGKAVLAGLIFGLVLFGGLWGLHLLRLS